MFQAAARLLSHREHTRAELRRKLLARAWSADDIDVALQRLAEQGMQSDERFTEQYVRLRTEKGYGPARISAELRERGVNGALVDAWLQAGDSQWRDRMEQLVLKKYGQPPAKDNQREIARCGRFLAQRGFPSRLIREYLFVD